jgi:phospholipase C
MRAWVTRLSHSIAQIAGMTTLSAIQNIVVLMLENRSFDHMHGMPGSSNAYFMPGADPGEGYQATNSQLFGANAGPTPPLATNQGFVQNYAYMLR